MVFIPCNGDARNSLPKLSKEADQKCKYEAIGCIKNVCKDVWTLPAVLLPIPTLDVIPNLLSSQRKHGICEKDFVVYVQRVNPPFSIVLYQCSMWAKRGYCLQIICCRFNMCIFAKSRHSPAIRVVYCREPFVYVSVKCHWRLLKYTRTLYACAAMTDVDGGWGGGGSVSVEVHA